MTRSAAIQSKRSNAMALIAGISLIILAIVIAVIAAMPASKSTAPASAAPTVAATPAPSVARQTGALRAKESNFEFGSISMAAGKVSHRFWFRNESTTPVLMQRVYTSCMCTTATLVKGMRVIGSYGMPGHGPLPDVNESLAPNEAAYLDVVFDPAAHGPAGLGRTERVVTIEPARGEPLQFAFVANVTP